MLTLFKKTAKNDFDATSGATASETMAAMAAASSAAAAELTSRLDEMKRTAGRNFVHAVDSSVNLSELICLMAWSNGNVRTLSSETTTVSAAIEEVARSIENIAGLAGSAQARAADTHAIVRAGSARASSAGRAMQEISDAFSGLEGRMQELGGAIESIGGFAKQIEGISSQTKLLALNATIEAARAGEAGRGFAVVAAEVKALSEETSKTTDLIRDQLTALADVMQGMMQAMSAGGTKVRDGRETFDAVSDDMMRIEGNVGEVNDSIGAIAGMLTDQQSATESMAKSLGEIARLAGQNEKDIGTSAELITRTDALLSDVVEEARSLDLPDYAAARMRSDHMIWKRRLAECLVGLKPIDARAFAQNNDPLGRFYGEATDLRQRNASAFQMLDRHVETMRRESKRLVEEVARGQMGPAIDAYMAMDKSSGETMTALKALR